MTPGPNPTQLLLLMHLWYKRTSISLPWRSLCDCTLPQVKAPPHWNTYISTAKLEKTGSLKSKSKALSGIISAPPQIRTGIVDWELNLNHEAHSIPAPLMLEGCGQGNIFLPHKEAMKVKKWIVKQKVKYWPSVHHLNYSEEWNKNVTNVKRFFLP